MPVNTVVAYSPYRWDHALTVLRLVSPLRYAGIHLIHGNEGSDIHPESVSLGDAVVIQRDFPNYLEMYEIIAKRARDERRPLIYEIDDLLLELPDEHPDTSTGYYTPALFSMLRAIIEADLVTTTNFALRDYLLSFNSNVAVLPNCLDEELWSLPYRQKKPEKLPLVIGYMGSDTHLPDLQQITPVLHKLLVKYNERICLRFWGGEPPSEIRDYPQVEWVRLEAAPYPEFARYFSQQECDIFVAPLKDSLFNRCKSAIKFLEYSALAIPGVYSRITPYEEVVMQGENGYLAATQSEWEDCLVRLIEDPHLRHQIGRNAQDSVGSQWLTTQHAHEWAQAYESAVQVAAEPHAHPPRQEYQQVFIRVANQVRAWQNRMVAQMQEKDQIIHDQEKRLSEAERFPNEIKSSTAWKLVQWMWKLRSLFPPRNDRRG